MERLDLDTRQFTQADVLQILPRLSSRTLQTWKYRGLLDSEEAGSGKGKRHLYNAYGIVMLAFMERIVDFGLDPAEVKQMAPRAAECANDLWSLKIDSLRPNGMRQIRNWFVEGNDVYRRAFIYRQRLGNRNIINIGRRERTGSFSPLPYIVDAMDIQNIGVLNRINRHIAGLSAVEVHIPDDFDSDGPAVEAQMNFDLKKIASLPIDARGDDV